MGDYKFTTYRETCDRIEAIGRGLISLGAKAGDKVLIYSETRPEWLLSAFGAFRHGMTVVTLYSTLGGEAVKHGINESEVEIIITSSELLSKLDVKIQEVFFCVLFMNLIRLENIRSYTESSSCNLFFYACEIANGKYT